MVRLIKPYQCHVDSVAADSDTDSDDDDSADGDDTVNEETGELLTASESVDEQSLASAGERQYYFFVSDNVRCPCSVTRRASPKMHLYLHLLLLLLPILWQGGHKPGKPRILRDFSEHGKLEEFCATAGKNCSSSFKYLCKTAVDWVNGIIRISGSSDPALDEGHYCIYFLLQ